ncbi:MAG: phospholipase D-like domain-containing protein [Pseudomonadota bacterium]
MVTRVGNVAFYMGSHKNDTQMIPGHPGLDDLEAVIIDFIDAAEKRLVIAVQELESEAIALAILRAEIERKVQVKIVLEADYLASKKRPKTVEEAFTSKGPHETNRVLAAALLRGTAWVRSDFNPKIFHQKFIVRDREAVLTGSTNFTPQGVGSSKSGGNLNHILVVEDKAFAKVFEREFAEISNGDFGKNVGSRNVTPDDEIVSGVRLKACFAPDHNPEMEIMKQIAKARERIDFAIFTFSQSSGIDDALKQAMNADIPVSGVMEALQGGKDWSATKPLIDAGAHLVRVKKKGGVINKLHHKLMTLDDKAMVVGSFNYTGAANLTNDENIVVVSGEAAEPMVKAARLEIDRIREFHGVPFED